MRYFLQFKTIFNIFISLFLITSNITFADMEKNGFIEDNEADSHFMKLMLQIKNGSNPFLNEKKMKFNRANSDESKVMDSSLQTNASNIPLSFHFNGIKNDDINIIGYAPTGTTLNNKWTGIGVYFQHKKFGGCYYNVLDAGLSKAKITLISDLVHYKINNKISTNATKKNKYGYLSEVSWYDKNYFSSLECVNDTFTAETNEKLIEFAKHLDDQFFKSRPPQG